MSVTLAAQGKLETDCLTIVCYLGSDEKSCLTIVCYLGSGEKNCLTTVIYLGCPWKLEGKSSEFVSIGRAGQALRQTYGPRIISAAVTAQDFQVSHAIMIRLCYLGSLSELTVRLRGNCDLKELPQPDNGLLLGGDEKSSLKISLLTWCVMG